MHCEESFMNLNSINPDTAQTSVHYAKYDKKMKGTTTKICYRFATDVEKHLPKDIYVNVKILMQNAISVTNRALHKMLQEGRKVPNRR